MKRKSNIFHQFALAGEQYHQSSRKQYTGSITHLYGDKCSPAFDSGRRSAVLRQTYHCACLFPAQIIHSCN